MSLWTLIFGRREPEPESVQARDVAARIGRRADEINEQLQKYQKSRDPFAALMADMYNRDQLTRIHHGNKQ